jgi:hypothetical protein
MMSIEQIKTALADRRLLVVAKNTGISYGTLLTIRDSPEANPSLKIMLSLEKYLSGASSE